MIVKVFRGLLFAVVFKDAFPNVKLNVNLNLKPTGHTSVNSNYYGTVSSTVYAYSP